MIISYFNHLILSVATQLQEWPNQYGCLLAAFSQQITQAHMHHNQLRTELYGLIQSQWEKLINVTKAVLGETYETGKLYFERARYYITKMEHSLKEFNIQPMRLPKSLRQADNQVPIVENINEEPPTLQFKQLCRLILQQQEEQQTQDDTMIRNEQLLNNNASLSDLQLSLQCIKQAIKIFEIERKADKSNEINAQIDDLLTFAKGKQAIVLMIGSKYAQAAQQLRSIIHELSQRKADGGYSNQQVAEYTFILGNCILLADESGCQEQALQLFLKSIRMYLNHLLFNLNYNAAFIPLPSIGGTPIDRFPYLAKPDDSEQVKLIKEVMAIVLDKIEDVGQILKIKKIMAQENDQLKQKRNKQNIQSNSHERKLQEKSRKRMPQPSFQSQQADFMQQYSQWRQKFLRKGIPQQSKQG